MNRNIILDQDTFSSIQKMLNDNLNLNQIVIALKNEKNFCYSYTTIKGIIQRNFHKEWDREKKKWVERKSEPKLPKGFLEGQLGLDEAQEFFDAPVPKKEEPKQNKSVELVKSVCSEITVQSKDSDNDTETVSTILKKLYRLQKDVDDIKKILLQLQRDNPKNRVIEVTDEFFRIYASDKNKSSVSINTELRDKVKKLMEEAYGIKDNDSLVINLALLMALYRGK